MNKIKTGFFKGFIVAAVFLFAAQAAESRETVDRVVAIVNNDIITLSEMNDMVTSIKLTNNQNMSQNEVLQQMIEQKLFEQEAERLGIKVSEAELDASIAQVKQRFNLNDEQMAEVLQKQNLTPESFREQWRLQTLSNKLLDSQLKNKIVVTDEEIATYYRQNYDGTGTVVSTAPSSGPVEEVRIAHILISANSPDAEARARKIADMAKSGQDFGQLAKEYSDDSHSADKGGDLGYFKQGDLIETLETAIENTSAGNVAGPVESPAGYHVIKVMERKTVGGGEKKAKKGSSESQGPAIDEQTKKEITDRIYRQKAEEQLKVWLDGIKSNAYIDVRL